MSLKPKSKPKKSSSNESIANKKDKSMKPSTSTLPTGNSTLSCSSNSNDRETNEKCLCEGCNNPGVSDAEWLNGFCSFDCSYIYSKKEFDEYLES